MLHVPFNVVYFFKLFPRVILKLYNIALGGEMSVLMYMLRKHTQTYKQTDRYII